MSRSIFLVDTFYLSVLHTQGIDKVLATGQRYDDVLREALDFGFGTGGAYLRALRELGWDAQLVIANSLGLQDLWMRERHLRKAWSGGWEFGPHLARLPLANAVLHRFPHLHRVLFEQIKAAKPDVVMVQDLNLIPPGLARAIRKHTGLLVGEIASPLPPKPFLMSYHLIVSALPSIVETVTGWGIPATSIPLGFDDRWAAPGPASARPIDAIFIGSFSRLQPQTTPLLKEVSKTVPGLRIYGPASPQVLRDAGLSEFYHGQAWGRDMFALLGQSKLVVNRHGRIAGPYAVNMRMYEATGSGAALITEQKANLADLFTPGEEVLTYTDAADAAQQAAGILADPTRLDRVAAAGQARTLREHTYRQRAETLTEVIAQRLG